MKNEQRGLDADAAAVSVSLLTYKATNQGLRVKIGFLSGLLVYIYTCIGLGEELVLV